MVMEFLTNSTGHISPDSGNALTVIELMDPSKHCRTV